MGRRTSQKRLGKTWSCTPDQLHERHRWARRGRGTKSTQGHWLLTLTQALKHMCRCTHTAHTHACRAQAKGTMQPARKSFLKAPLQLGQQGFRVPRRQSQCLMPVQPQRWGSLAGGYLQGQWGWAQLKPHMCDIIKVVNVKVGACFLQKPHLPRRKGSPATEVPEDHQLGGRMECCVGDCVTKELSQGHVEIWPNPDILWSCTSFSMW